MTYNLAVRTAWKTKAAIKKTNRYDVAAYSIIRALFSRANDKVAVARGILLENFAPIANDIKLVNGQRAFQALDDALVGLEVGVKLGTGFFGYDFLNDEEKKRFAEILKELRKEPFVDTTYAYIFVRQDISREQQLVQAAHVAMVLGQSTKVKAKNLHFCVFGTPNGETLVDTGCHLDSVGIETVAFFEPDLNNEMTAFACLPMRKSKAIRKGLFTNDKLLVLDDKTFSTPKEILSLAA